MNPPPKPDVLVEGLLHRGTKAILAGGSKSFKTWTLIDLALQISVGGNWWGFKCRPAKVLFCNFEIQDGFFTERLEAIKAARGIVGPTPNLHVWNLRGYATDISELEAAIKAQASEHDYFAMIMDPIYKCLGERDENSNGQIAEMLNALERIAVQLNTMILFGHHYAKGNASGKYAIDRMSGAGAWARDPDTIITMTPHEEEDAFVVDMILRNMAPQEPFVVRRAHPIMVRDDDADTEKLREPGKRQGYSLQEVLATFPKQKDGTTSGEWQAVAEDVLGISNGTFHNKKKQLLRKGMVFVSESPGPQKGKYFLSARG